VLTVKTKEGTGMANVIQWPSYFTSNAARFGWDGRCV
jgi:hypothetical protein